MAIQEGEESRQTKLVDRRAVVSHLLTHAGSARRGERVLLIIDETTRELGARFTEVAADLGLIMEVAEIPVAPRHGIEPSDDAKDKMRRSTLAIGLTKMSLAHTVTRGSFCGRGGRYLSLPGYSEDLLAEACVLANYRAQLPLARAIANAFTAGSTVHVTTSAGTDMKLAIDGRKGNCCPGFVDSKYSLGSPPDIEANVSPLEDQSQGIAVIDGSVTCDGIGLLAAPVTLKIKNGRITDVSSELHEIERAVRKLLASVHDPNAYVLAECGVGLNPLARLTGNMLTDEGVLGSVHFGFGSNATVGGVIDVPFHVDFVLRSASLWIDAQQIFDTGNLCLTK